MTRVLLVELRRAFRRRATRRTALAALGCLFLVMDIGLIKVGDLPPIRYITQSDGVVTFSSSDFNGTVRIEGNKAHFTRKLNPSSPHAPRGEKFPLETNTEDLQNHEVVGIVGKPGHESVFVGFPNASLARFGDLYHRGSDNSTITPPAVLGIMFALLLGATLAGADWRWNTYAVLLTWVPQRRRLLAARLIGCFVVGAVTVSAVVIAYALFTIPIVLVHGNFAGLTSSWWTQILELLGRVALLAGLTSLAGACVAIVVRNTIGALVVALIYLMVLEHLLLALLPKWWPLAFGRYLPILYDWKAASVNDKVFVHPGGASVALAVGICLTIATAFVSFTKRDVTAS
jgi:hypothetical protein